MTILLPERGYNTKPAGLIHWVKEFIQRNELTYSPDHFSFIHKDHNVFPTNHKEVITTLYLYAIDYGFQANSKSILQDIWGSLCQKEHERHKSRIKSELLAPVIPPERKNAAEVNLARLVYAMTGKKNILDIAALKHFMWCVKKNMEDNTHEISHVMMPVIFGKQDTGKTTIINGLLSPLKDLTIKSDFNVFKDDRNLQAFTRMFVIFLDEMGKAKETAIESIKKIMSNGSLLQREFHSQDVFNRITSRATFIAATNKHLSDIVIDDEMRRFWQIEMADYKHVHKHWDVVKNMDWVALWDCVETTDREPADIMWHLFKKTQAIYANGDHISGFLAERIEENADTWHEAMQFYRDYQVWCEHHEFTKQLTKGQFFHRVKDKILNKNSSGTKYCYSLKPFKDPEPVIVEEENYDECYE